MAEIVVVPAVGAPPVVGTVALQLPYVADQGTLTKWLVDNTAGASPDEILVILAATNTKYAEAAAKIADGQADAASSLVKELAEDILAAEPLEVFLTVTTPEGGKSIRRKVQERADRATHLSTDDVRALEGVPGVAPEIIITC